MIAFLGIVIASVGEDVARRMGSRVRAQVERVEARVGLISDYRFRVGRTSLR